MTTTHAGDTSIATTSTLCLAMDLGWGSWKLAFTVGLGRKPRLRTMRARDVQALLAKIRAAKERFGLPEDASVVCCYEAGRDGFWLHRCLEAHGAASLVGDSATSADKNDCQRFMGPPQGLAEQPVKIFTRRPWRNEFFI